MIQGYSPWVDHAIIPKPIDFIFIDGNHNTQWALMDYFYWSHYLPIDGIVGFHDTNAETVSNAISMLSERDKNIQEMPLPKTRRGVRFFKKVRSFTHSTCVHMREYNSWAKV